MLRNCSTFNEKIKFEKIPNVIKKKEKIPTKTRREHEKSRASLI